MTTILLKSVIVENDSLESSRLKNMDPRTVAGFGEEWSHFNQRDVGIGELTDLFNKYFKIFPWSRLPANSTGFDAGCGSGRWARFVSQRVGKLHCVDASPKALETARESLRHQENCEFHCTSIAELPFPDGTMDFGYSLGVLHHMPDTQAGLNACVKKLKEGAPFLTYLYYDYEGRPAWFLFLWRASDVARKLISASPFWLRFGISQILAVVLYFPLARLSYLLEKMGMDVSLIPFSFYRHRSFYTMRTDALDRFGTRLEQRFSQAQIRAMMELAGLKDITISDDVPYWCAIGYKKSKIDAT